jgi:hypothetical protein
MDFAAEKGSRSPAILEGNLSQEGLIVPSTKHADPELAEKVRALGTRVDIRNASSNALGEAANSLATLINFFDRIAQANMFALIAWSAVATTLRVSLTISYLLELY